MAWELRATRYLSSDKAIRLGAIISQDLHQMSWRQARRWYRNVLPWLDLPSRALLACNDRFFLLTVVLGRKDVDHPWLYARCREVEQDPDGHLDLWARFHYKSTIITYAGAIQEILVNPEITIAIFSVVKPIAQEFLSQIKEEFESNADLHDLFPDVLYREPKKKDAVDGRPAKWSLARGITVKRKSNPKEATIEAHGLIDGQPTSRHFGLHIYDDVVTQDHLSEEQIKKTTTRWEMADNLGSHWGVRKWVAGTPYHFADTYVQLLERRSLKPRKYPATDNGTLTGKPVFLTSKRWAQIIRDQRSTVSAQMLLNPIAGNEATFQSIWFKQYHILPSAMNVYIMVDPSKGKTKRSDRSAIAVIGIDVNGNRYFLDGVCHRMKLSQRWEFIKSLHDKWTHTRGVQNVTVGYEQYGMQTDLETLEDIQLRENRFITMEEMNTPQKGEHSKDDRIERLEPDVRNGEFFFPAVVWHPEFGNREHFAYWSVWTPEKQQAFEARAKTEGRVNAIAPYQIGEIVYRPVLAPQSLQQWCKDTGQHWRIVTPLRRRDEDKNIYDVTRTLMLEMIQHPFAQFDDLVDAASRLYDLKPCAPSIIESAAIEGLPEDHMGQPLEYHLDS